MADVVSIEVAGKTVKFWNEYDLSVDMLVPADSFNLTFAPLTQELYELLEPDSEIRVFMNEAPIMTGFIESRNSSEDPDQGSQVSIRGKDKIGRLVVEDMDPGSLEGLSFGELAQKIAGDWFESISFSNARNRNAARGDGGKADVGAEPDVPRDSEISWDVEPGDKRWDVLSRFLEPAGLLAWSSTDGKELIIGKPNYNQHEQFTFFLQNQRGNILDWNYAESVEELYSEVVAHGSKLDSGEDIIARAHSERLKHRKTMRLRDEFDSLRDAERRVQRMIKLQESSANVLTLTVGGHSQRMAPILPYTVYMIDTLAKVGLAKIGLVQNFLITALRYMRSNQRTETEITLVPSGTKLTL